MIDYEHGHIVAVDSVAGRQHDFALCTDTLPELATTTYLMADSGYQGLADLHHAEAVQIPYKASKNNPLSDQKKDFNRRLARKRVRIEHLFARLKVFKILAHRYRNRRQRFELRFSVIAALYNLQINDF
jgi:IS5 family transposase